MYRLKVIDCFSSAHQLRGYRGKCEALHGHNWKVEVTVTGERLDSIGLLIDFKDLKEIVHAVLTQLDHKFLNDIPPFDELNPSSELMAQHLYTTIQDRLPGKVSLEAVCVWESENSCAEYRP